MIVGQRFVILVTESGVTRMRGVLTVTVDVRQVLKVMATTFATEPFRIHAKEFIVTNTEGVNMADAVVWMDMRVMGDMTVDHRPERPAAGISVIRMHDA